MNKKVLLGILICILYIIMYKNQSFAGNSIVWDKKVDMSYTSLSSIVYGTNKAFVAVGNEGTILISNDGIKWNENKSGIDDNLIDIAFNNNIYVAVGANGTILTSSDTVNWTKQNSGITNNISTVIWDGIKFVAAANNLGLISYDGINWSNHIIPILDQRSVVKDVYWDGNKYLAVGDLGSNLIIASQNAIDWTVSLKMSVGLEGTHFNSIVSNGNKYIAVGQNGSTDAIIANSTDTLSWKINKNVREDLRIPFTGTVLHDVIWTGQKFIAVGGFENPGIILTSNNGDVWRLTQTDNHKSLLSIASSNDKKVVVGADGIIYLAIESDKWVKIERNSLPELDNMVWDGKQYIAKDLSNIYTSPDGYQWTKRTSNPLANYGRGKIIWNDNKYVTIFEGGYIFSSSDAVTWTGGKIAADVKLRDIIWAGNKFLITGDYFKNYTQVVYISNDGAKWNRYDTNKNVGIKKVIWDGKMFIAAGGMTFVKNNDGSTFITTEGNNGVISVSLDGIKWDNAEHDECGNLSDVCWNGSTFVAAGSGGTIMASLDGLNWSKVNSNTNVMLKNILYNGVQYVVVGVTDIIISKDGFTWNSISNNDIRYFTSIIWDTDRYIAIGVDKRGKGFIKTSYNCRDWDSKYEINNGLPEYTFWGSNKYFVYCNNHTIYS